MKHLIHRRTVLGLIVSGLLSACGQKSSNKKEGVEARHKQQQKTRKQPSEVYQHGVASGDPDQHSVVIWTRVSLNNAAVVEWEVSTRADFSSLISSGSVATSADQDYTVKAIPTGLMPGTRYFYRFKVDGVVSPVGRTRTLPDADLEQYGIALVSCSNFAFGYFNAYDAIANDTDVDLVLHTGDYIYEYAADGWGGATAAQLGRVHQPAHETVTLDDYRTRHAQYKTDAGSQAMHAAHPLICCWDDHESTNNPWLYGAQNHQPDSEGNWSERRDASVQAYYEWMPIRDPKNAALRLAFSRAYRIGNLASIVTLESRHTARAEQINYLDYMDTISSVEDAQKFHQTVIHQAGREMISTQTEDLLVNTFKQRSGHDRPWHLVGNASPIARMLVPNVESSGVVDGESAEQRQSDAAKSLLWKGRYNLPFYTDTWDGYPWARERLYDRCRNSGNQDLLFLTGDSHSFWMNQLADASGNAMGLEVGTAGVSSPGDFVESGWSPAVAEQLDRLFESKLDEVLWTDNLHQGYVKVVLTKHIATTSYIAVNTVLSPNYSTSLLKQFRIARANGQLNVLS